MIERCPYLIETDVWKPVIIVIQQKKITTIVEASQKLHGFD